jgi:hypothetical protein
MTKNQKLYTTISIILIGTWLYATPYLTIYSMKKASENNDETKFSSYINYPSLRESFKNTFKAAFNKELMKDSNEGEDGLGNLGKVFGIALASAVIDPLVESFVTPESLAMMMQGKKPKGNESNKKTATNSNEKKSNLSMGYDGIDYFVLDAKDDKNEIQFSFVFKRKGVWNWELTSIRNLNI